MGDWFVAVGNGSKRHLPMLLLLVLGIDALAEQSLNKQSIVTDADLRGWYAGGGYVLTDGFDSQNATAQSDSGYVINAGYRFMKFVAAEAGYLQDSNFSSAQFSGVFIVPFLERWEAYAKIGWSLWEADTAPAGVKDDDDGLLAGVGLGVTVWNRWHFRLEYQAVNLQECSYYESCSGPDPGTLDSFAAELHYRFGNGWK
jgi:hypothetical protein